jgi:hypothetical protein
MAPPWWVLPFGHPRIKACLAAPRGLSQLATSFIASNCQGVHRLPLLRLCGTHSIHLSRSTRQNAAIIDPNTAPEPCQGPCQETRGGDCIRPRRPRQGQSGRLLSEESNRYSCLPNVIPSSRIDTASRSSASNPSVSPRSVGSISASSSALRASVLAAKPRRAERSIFRRAP